MKPTAILVTVLLFLSIFSWAQRRDRPQRHCNHHGCVGDSLRREDRAFRSRERRDEFGGMRPCRSDSAFNKGDVDQKIEETDFGEFAPYEASPIEENRPNPTDTTGALPPSFQPGSGNDSIDIAFGEFTDFSVQEGTGISSSGRPKNLPWIIAALGITLLAGVFVRFQRTRKFRYLFLIPALVIFGFYLGGCPCPVSGFQHVLLAGLGTDQSWQSMIWFIGLIPITYVFGKVWCGWICHLGGLQELLFRKGKLNYLKGERAKRILKWTRILLLAVLVVQVSITKTNLFKEIDPFKAAFNLYPSNSVTWVLLVMLIISSIFIYRPFCRSVCPVGLVLGWIGRIPGASRLSVREQCNSCKLCEKTCESRAITNRNGWVKIDNEECIRCGDCLENCSKNRLRFSGNPLLTRTTS